MVQLASDIRPLVHAIQATEAHADLVAPLYGSPSIEITKARRLPPTVLF